MSHIKYELPGKYTKFAQFVFVNSDRLRKNEIVWRVISSNFANLRQFQELGDRANYVFVFLPMTTR